MMNITERLFALQDLKYKEFQCKLMPTVDPDKVIGVRMPQLRALAKELRSEALVGDFLYRLPHEYYEEDNLHALFIERIRDFDECIGQVDRFLPFVDNWATCDMLRPRCFRGNTDKLNGYIEKWLCSGHIYTVRFGIGMLMTHYLDEHFDVRYPERISAIESDEYYINMMTAWYFATALAKQWDRVIGYLEDNRLPLWVHNKTIQKAIESYRISESQKEYLKRLKRKHGA